MHALVDHMKLPMDPIQESILLLEKNSLLVETGDDPPAYLPARDISTITLQDLFKAIRMADSDTLIIEKQLTSIPGVDSIIENLDDAAINALDKKYELSFFRNSYHFIVHHLNTPFQCFMC